MKSSSGTGTKVVFSTLYPGNQNEQSPRFLMLHMTPRIRAGLALLVALVPVRADNLISQIGWKGASSGVLVGLFIALVASIIFILITYTRNRKKIQESGREQSEKLFEEYSSEQELNSEERKTLRDLLKYDRGAQPHIIFQSITLFERCVDARVNELLNQKLPEDWLREEETIIGGIRKKLGYHYLAYEHPLVSSRNIQYGQIVSIFGKDTSIPLIQKGTVTFNGEILFRVQYTAEKEEMFLATPHTPLRLAFARQNDAVYGIPVTVAGNDGAGVVEFYHTLELKRNQLRQYVRIEASLPVKFRIIRSESNENKDFCDRMSQAKMSDISGGGLSFLFEKPLTPGDILSVNFQLPGASFAGIAAKVLRVSLQEGKTATFYKHHIQFSGIESRQRDQIVRFVFEKQRQLSQWR